MDKPIENPKVFISYAWGTEDYQQKVLNFAARLKGDGISVVIDKWSMDAGNDTFAFMEKSVRDETINFVLILLDPLYAQKADDRSGGVGTETQIISSEIYNNISQNKFVPIVFERGENNKICKPTYLKSRLHFDLTTIEYEHEYIKLIRHIYGRKTYPEPPLGKKPNWIDSPKNIVPINFSELEFLKDSYFTSDKTASIINIFEKLFNNINDNISDSIPYPDKRDLIEAQIILNYRNSFIPFREIYI